MKSNIAFYDAKTYDRDYFASAAVHHDLQWQFHEFRLNTGTAATSAGAMAVCVFVNDHLDAPCIEGLRGTSIQLIALRCAGFNNVDLDAAREAGIAVVRVPAYSPYAVAEHTVALLLALNRKIHRAYNRVREHNFSLAGLVGFDLHGKTIGIIGTGKIGKVAAEILGGFGTTLLAHDPFPDHKWAKTLDVQYEDLAVLLKRSDVVTLHLPLTLNTRHLLNSTTFNQMKQASVLINTSRGKLIDTKALLGALKSGRVSGCSARCL